MSKSLGAKGAGRHAGIVMIEPTRAEREHGNVSS
jgi:hypothetical protein